MKEYDIIGGGQNILWPLVHIFRGQDLPNAQDYAAAGAGFFTGWMSFLSSGQRYQSAVELGMCSAGTNWAVAILRVTLLMENFRCGCWFQRFCHGFLFSHKGTGKVQSVLVLQCGMRGLIARRKYRRMKAEVNDNNYADIHVVFGSTEQCTVTAV